MIGRGCNVVAKRLSDRTFVWRQIIRSGGEGRAGRSEVYSGIVILHCLCNGQTQLPPIFRRRDAPAFTGIAQKSAFQQHCRNPDVSQYMKSRVMHAAIENRQAREHSAVNGRSERHVLLILRVSVIGTRVGDGIVTLGRCIRRHSGGRKRVALHASTAAAGVEVNADENSIRKSIRKIDPLLECSRDIVRSRHRDFVSCVLELCARSQRDIESKSLFVSPTIRRTLIVAAVTGIEHDRFYFVCVVDSVRAQDWLDDFAHVHDRNQSVIGVADNREVGKEPDAVDIDFARTGLGAQAATIVAQRNVTTHASVLRELIELRDVCERNVIAILQTDYVPIGAEYWRCGSEKCGNDSCKIHGV